MMKDITRRSVVVGLVTVDAAMRIKKVEATPITYPHGTTERYPDWSEPHRPCVPSGEMRISTETGDVGTEALAEIQNAGKSVKVYLDDVEQKWATIADTWRGYVVRFKLGPDGDLFIDPSNNIVQEIRYGKVRIEIV